MSILDKLKNTIEENKKPKNSHSKQRTHNKFTNHLINYKKLKKTLRCKNGYLFLVDDANNELRQHFDPLFKNNFDPYLFIKNLNSKKKFCDDRNIKYYFFMVPDKSLICKDFLPFEVKIIKRNYDLISDLVPDFALELDPSDYYMCDSHMNYLSGKKLAYHFLNYINPDFKRLKFNELVRKQISSFYFDHEGDLLSDINWSYSEDEKTDYIKEKTEHLSNSFLINLKDVIPEKFRVNGPRESEFYRNEHSYKELRVLIFRDSTSVLLQDILMIYFKETFLYWDKWFFNKELIEWYKPDIILEIRAERFLENNDIQNVFDK